MLPPGGGGRRHRYAHRAEAWRAAHTADPEGDPDLEPADDTGSPADPPWKGFVVVGTPLGPAPPPPQYASLCTPFTARPEGSFIAWKAASHASASGVLHATDFPPRTVSAAEGRGKCSSKTAR